MAAVGMCHLVVTPITAEASNTITYGTGAVAEHVINGDVTYNYDESDLYGDDILAEHYKMMTSADIEIGITELEDSISTLIGIESSTTSDNVTTYKLVTANNTACGVGFIQRLLKNGVESFNAYWFHKVSFSVDNENSKTRGESLEWGTPTLHGKGWPVVLTAGGATEIRDRQVFTTQANALAWLKTKANVTP